MYAPLKILDELGKARKEFIDLKNEEALKVIDDMIIRLREVVNGGA
jgi:hypothetical protein